MMTPEERSAAQARYAGRLADAFDSVVAPTLRREHAEWTPMLDHVVVSGSVKHLKLDVACIAVPKADGSNGRILHAYTWDQIDALGPTALAEDLLEAVRHGLAYGDAPPSGARE